MQFCELLSKYSDEQIVDFLHVYYKDIQDKPFMKMLKKLRMLKIGNDENTKIIIEWAVDDFVQENNETKYLDCYGYGPDEDGAMTRYGIQFSPWSDWLAMEIDSDSIKNLGCECVVASIIWEMTFYGYSEKEIKRKVDKILNSLKKAEEHIVNIKE